VPTADCPDHLLSGNPPNARFAQTLLQHCNSAHSSEAQTSAGKTFVMVRLRSWNILSDTPATHQDLIFDMFSAEALPLYPLL